MTYLNSAHAICSLLFLVVFAGCERTPAVDSSGPASTPFLVSPVQGTSLQLSNRDALQQANSRDYLFTTCIKDLIYQRPIPQELFSISGGEQSLPVRTDEVGCVHWQEQVKFDSAQSGHWLSLSRQLNGNANYPGQVLLKIELNPWAETPVLDARYEHAPTAGRNVALSRAVPGLDFQEVTFAWLKERYDLYRVDRFLNLSVSHEYRMTFAPLIRRWISDRWTSESIDFGKLRIDVAVVPENREQEPDVEHPLSLESYDVELSSKRVVMDVVVNYPKQVFATIRNRLVIQIRDSEQKYPAATFEGYLLPQQDAGHLIMMTSRRFDMAEIERNLRRSQTVDLPISPLELFRKTKKTQDIAWAEFPVRSTAEKWLQARGKYHDDDVLRTICRRVYAPKTFRSRKQKLPLGPLRDPREDDLQYCLRKPTGSFRVMAQDFVEQIIDPVPETREYPESWFLSLQLDLQHVREDIHKSEEGETVQAEVGLSETLGPLSVGVGYRTFSTEIDEIITGSKRLAISDLNKRFYVAERPIRVKARVRTCMVLVPRENATFPPQLLCDSQTHVGDFAESYFYVTQNFAMVKTPSEDPYGPNGALRFIIRGKHRFKAFADFVQSHSLKLAHDRSELLYARDLENVVANTQDMGVAGAFDSPVLEYPVVEDTYYFPQNFIPRTGY